MTKKFFFPITVALLCMACSAAPHRNTPPAFTEVSGFTHPESVIQAGGSIYVSNIGGFISKVDARTGQLEQLRFLPTEGALDKPMGLLVIGRTIYVADLKRVRGFDLLSRAEVFNLEIPQAINLNDLELISSKEGHVSFYASDYYANKIFKIRPETRRYAEHAHVVGANGLAFDPDSQVLYVAGLDSERSTSGAKKPYFGAIYKVTADGTVSEWLKHGLFLDGIALREDRLYFSDWGVDNLNGSLSSVPRRGPQTVRKEAADIPLKGPADFSLSANGHTWLMPAMLEGKILVVRVENPRRARKGHKQ